MTQAARIRQADAKRLFAGAKQAGFARVRISIDAIGNIVVDASNDAGEVAPSRRNPLDRLLGE